MLRTAPLQGSGEGELWGGCRHPSPQGSCCFFCNVMQQLAFLLTGTAAACTDRLPALLLPTSSSSLLGALPALWYGEKVMNTSQHHARAGQGRIWPGDGDAGQPLQLVKKQEQSKHMIEGIDTRARGSRPIVSPPEGLSNPLVIPA